MYSAVDSPMGTTHYNASVQVFSDVATGSQVEWIVDVLPTTSATSSTQQWIEAPPR